MKSLNLVKESLSVITIPRDDDRLIPRIGRGSHGINNSKAIATVEEEETGETMKGGRELASSVAYLLAALKVTAAMAASREGTFTDEVHTIFVFFAPPLLCAKFMYRDRLAKR